MQSLKSDVLGFPAHWRVGLVPRSAGRILMRVLALAGFLAAMTACAGLAEGPKFTTIRGLDGEVFSEGYSLIAERYIEPVAVNQLALDGLGALNEVDSSIAVVATGGKIAVNANQHTVSEFVAPPRDDAEAWGVLTAAVVEAGQDASPNLRALRAEKIYETVFEGALAKLDRYSRYAGAEEARNERADREGFGGIGIHLSVNEGVTRIVAVMPGTPAEEAGVKDNDVITRVEGEPIAGLDLRDVVKRLRGAVGSIARFTLMRHGLAEALDVEVRRRLIIPTSVIYRPEGDIAYIRITRFNQGTANSFRRAAIRAKREMGSNLRGMVLDLRDNPGGLLDQAVAVADSLLGGGRIVSTRGRHRGSFQQYDATGHDVTEGLPLVVLVNGGSASASEIVAAALQDDGRAVIVGSNSYGKGLVQSVYRLPNDGELTLTWSRFHAPSGYNLQDLGVLPTICTSTPKADPKLLLQALREGHSDTAMTLATWRRAARPEEEVRKALREACPAGAHPDDDLDRDLNIARTVIEDQALYALALKQSSIPELARRQQ